MNKIIIVLCEGFHDISFISKILLTNDYKSYNKRLKNFVSPLNELFKTKIGKEKIADRKLGFSSQYIIPSVALQNKEEDNLILFHNLNGDGSSKERMEIIQMYQNIQGDDDFSKYSFELRFIYLFDADELTINARLSIINKEMALSSPIENNIIKKIDSFEWGCYVYSDAHIKVLEDILLELMEPDNEEIFSATKEYIDNNKLHIDRCKEYTSNNNTYKTQNKFKNKKSIISIAGQLQFSGMNNSVIISKSDYVKKSDIESNKHCCNIFNLFQ